MLEIIREREKEKKKLLAKIKIFLKKAKRLGKVSVILYGSFSRDDFNAWSDIDLIIVAERLPKNIIKRQEVLYLFKIPKIEPKGYTKEEFIEMIKMRHPFIKVLAKEGKFLKDEMKLQKYFLTLK